ncbi:MAG: TrkH family potassium uptake protein [Schwartzia sp.]|nr:TrkH family potassium uptake protein [Schwartzia sp. (in: firmicutes)]
MDWRVVMYYLGRIAWVCGVALLVPFVISAAMADEATFSFGLSVLCCILIGGAGWKVGYMEEGLMTVREGIAVTGLAWLMTAFFGMLPYIFGEHLPLVDGIFESISGFTGFGATVIDTPEILPPSVLLWRSLTQWLGGLGIVVFFITLMPKAGQNAVYMYQAESSGPTEDRLRPRLKEMTGVLVAIYMSFTALAALTFAACGMSPFDAVNHALTTIGTGGFSTHSESVAYFDNVAIEAAMTFFILVSGVSFALYYRVYARGWRVMADNTEFKAYLSIFALGTVLLAAVLWRDGIYDLSDALRYAAFQTASISTTGFASTDYDRWPSFAKCLLLLLMMVGGCAGSTAAGLKVTRAVLLLRMVVANLWQRMHPHMVSIVRMNGEAVPSGVLLRVGLFLFVYFFFILLSALVLTLDGVPMFDAVGMSVSAVSTVGPAFGVVGPTLTYAPFSAFVKAVLCCVTLLGRLEFFTLLIMLRAEFWHAEKGW